MSTVAIRDLTKSFGSTPVLRGVDLEIPAGSLTAVLGPSGCGKTTLLRLLAGFTTPDGGSIRFDGTDVTGLPARARRVGYVPQEGALFPHLSIAANVTFGLPRAARKGARLGELLTMVGLDPAVAARFPHELSGGQQQRIALARALAPHPAVVLLDEPFSSLDAGLREDTGHAVSAALRAVGATAVLVTHDQGEALSLADQVAVMREGRLVQVDAPADVYRHPSDQGVARFVGGAVLLPGTAAGAYATCALGELAVDGKPVTGEVEVLIRPEQIRLGEEGVGAVVQEISYFGHDAAVRLALHDGGAAVVARVTGGDVPQPGADVHLTVRGEVPVFVRG
jgi:iron(III) transport system ATP-binding protein